MNSKLETNIRLNLPTSSIANILLAYRLIGIYYNKNAWSTVGCG